MDLVSYVAMLRRRWLAVVLCLVAGAGGGWYIGHTTAKVYSATARCIVSIPGTRNLSDQLQGAQLSGTFVATYAKIATSRAVASRVVQDLDLPQSPAAVQGHLSASSESDTYLIDISATGNTPEQAKVFADAGARALTEVVQGLEARNPDPVQVQLVDVADLPTSPVSPRTRLDLAVGVILGLLAGLLVAALVETLDRTVKTASQADAAFSAPLLGLVPRHRGTSLALVRDERGPLGEPYRSLRTAIRFLDPDRPLRTLLVTSATPGDGKTTTAANLAIALALSGEHVVIVDADLRRATLAESLGLERAIGLTSLILGSASLAEVLQEWDTGLDVLASGPLPPNPSEILGSQLFHQVLRELADIADIVIIDAPPVLPVADAVALSAHVDGVILVARHGETLRNAAHEARRRLDTVGANVVGYVLNAVPARETRDYYADYRYDSREARQALPAVNPVTLTPQPPRRLTPEQPSAAGFEPLSRLRISNGHRAGTGNSSSASSAAEADRS